MIKENVLPNGFGSSDPSLDYAKANDGGQLRGFIGIVSLPEMRRAVVSEPQELACDVPKKIEGVYELSIAASY